MSAHYIFTGNGGNGTVALLQWVYEQSIAGEFIWVNTGFAHHSWLQRQEEIAEFATRIGLRFISIEATPLSQWIRARHSFPSIKFPWCASVLKGLPLNAWLDEHDSECMRTVVLAKARCLSRGLTDLPEFIAGDAKFGARRVWHPLYNHSQEDFLALITRANFPLLSHRALECDPCVYNTSNDFAHLSSTEIARVAALENEVQHTMFGEPIASLSNQKVSDTEGADTIALDYSAFDAGCGAPFGCGL
jgi:hypothetical protein